jgi:uncharacterized protein YdhG (YjbR/CyaY superfamily)
VARRDFKSVDEYIAAQPEASQPTLERVRKAIRKALPRAEEVISYRIPAYRFLGVTGIYFAGWKTFYSVYPAGPRLVAAFKRELSVCKVKGFTIQFPLSEPVPEKLIGRIAKFRVKEVAARGKAQRSLRKKH